MVGRAAEAGPRRVRSNRGRIEAGVRAEPGGFQPVTLTARGQLAAGEPPERSQLFHSSSADIFLLVFITRQLIRCVCGFHSSFFFSVCVVGGNRPWLWFDSPLPSWVGTSLICILTLRGKFLGAAAAAAVAAALD